MSNEGYFSIVAIALKDIDADHALFRKVDPTVKITMVNGNTYYEYSWMHWYADTCVEIVDVMEYLEEIGLTNFGFIRVGEMSDDIDRIGCPNTFDMHISTSIDLLKHTTIESKTAAKIADLTSQRNYCDFECYVILSDYLNEQSRSIDTVVIDVQRAKDIFKKRILLNDELAILSAKGE